MSVKSIERYICDVPDCHVTSDCVETNLRPIGWTEMKVQTRPNPPYTLHACVNHDMVWHDRRSGLSVVR